MGRALAPAAGVLLALSLTVPVPARAQAPEAAFVTVDVLPLPDTPGLVGVDFADSEHGWAVGTYGTILATADGGRTWQRQVSGVEGELANPARPDRRQFISLTGVSFVDALHGWAVGDPDLILATADGGKSWSRQQPPPISSLNGAGPGPPNATEVDPEWRFRRVLFTGPQIGHIVGEGGTVLSTTDGGQTWVWRGNRGFGWVQDLSFPDPGSGRAVGTLGSPIYTALVSGDGGVTWTPETASNLGPGIAWANLSAVFFSDPQHGHVAGESGRIFVTSDGGKHWSVQRRDTTESFTRIAFATPRRGLVVGSTGFTEGKRASLVATADGGETWVSRLVPGAQFYDVSFATPTVAYAVGCSPAPDRPDLPQELRRDCDALIARVTFPAESAQSGQSSGGIPVGLLVAGAGLALVLAVFVFGRRRAHH